MNRSEPNGGGEGIDRIFPSDALPAELVPGTSVFRNHDHAFERALERSPPSAASASTLGSPPPVTAWR